MRTIQGYGWKRDTDRRAPTFLPRLARAQVPDTFDWWQRITAPPCWDQQQTGSCVGHGRARQHWLCRIICNLPEPFEPSRMGTYWQARNIEGSTGLDAGAEIHDAIYAGVTVGVGREIDWPFDESKVLDTPPQAFFDNAIKSEIKDYRRVDPTSIFDLMEAITIAPVVFGIPVFESFESKFVEDTGIVPMPAASEQLMGGHCMLFTGYDRSNSRFTVDNSWGPNWGKNGRCYLPFDYVTQQADDCWLVTLET